MRKKNWWVVASAGGIALSVLSLFLPVLSYTTAKGTAHSYNIVNLVTDPESFIRVVFDEYTGTLWIDSSMRTSIGRVILVAAVGVIALVLAATGIVTLSQQRRNVGPFVLAVLGLVGTALPAASLYILYNLSRTSFLGTIRVGVYAVVTPIAMILALVAVTWKRRRTLEELQAEEIAKQYFYDPGQTLSSGRNGGP